MKNKINKENYSRYFINKSEDSLNEQRIKFEVVFQITN